MTQRLRVLVLTTLFPHRPGEKEGNFILDQVRALAGCGAEVTVLVARPWLPVRFLAPANKRSVDKKKFAGEPFEIEGARFFSLPRFLLGERAYDRAAKDLLPRIGEIASKQSFDVFHAHGILMGHVANAASLTFGAPSVLTVHGIETSKRFDDTGGKRARIGEILEAAGKVVVVGSPLIEHCRKYTSKAQVEVIGNGCTAYTDLQPSSRIPRKRPFRVVAVSNYEESKGFHLLVEAIANPELRRELELVIVGGGDGFRKVQRQVKELGLEDSVHLAGLLPHRESLAEVLAADIFCLPSWREAFGIMYAEAMALGKFTIGCREQGPSDFVRHLETGYLIEPGNTNAIVEAMHWVTDNRVRADRIAKAGREYALSNLTWEANAEKMVAIYRGLVARHSGSEKLRGNTALQR